MKAAPVKIGVILVNWNCGELSAAALSSYINDKSISIECEVVVVDNGSTDNSLSVLQQYPVKLIRNKVNMGFGHACNQAIDQLNADYLLLLNPDTQSSITTLEVLVEFLENNPDYAITGPKQRNEMGEILKSCGRFPSFRTALYEVLGLSKLFPHVFKPAPIMFDWNHRESKDVDHIMGSYMLIRKAIVDRTGFMDPDYFVYWEDIDLSKRIHNNGFKSYYYSEECILHTGGGSGDKASSLRLFYSMSARHTYWKKHLGNFKTAVLTFLSLTAEPMMRFLKSPSNIGPISKAYILYIKRLLR